MITKMKKLSLYVLLVLMVCNVVFAETKRPELDKDYVSRDLNLNILKYNWKIDKVRSTSEADIYILKKDKWMLYCVVLIDPGYRTETDCSLP